MIGITGATGYVGGGIAKHLREIGFRTVALVRRPDAGSLEGESRSYHLGGSISPSLLDGIEKVVHCAFDFRPKSSVLEARNVDGSLPLVELCAAKSARFVLISTLSAFEGCRSHYGRAKLALEKAVLIRGGQVIRPGLVFGPRTEGLFGAIVNQVRSRRFVPLPGGGMSRLFLTHDGSLQALVASLLSSASGVTSPIFAAHERPTTVADLTEYLAGTMARRVNVIPVPYAAAHLALTACEAAHVALPFRRDSLVALQHPIPLDQVARLERSGTDFPAVREELWRTHMTG